ncbi:MAG: phenylalanine--tRNA ligase subunit beta [Firmicutes bacterium]|nr:phenylalanine--tRNA ligase subunit beta [Bacillota bacterium]
MNIPLSWLKEAAQIEDATPSLLDKMTNAGNAVEGVAKLGEDITGVVVGKIITLEKHPDADKLWVAQADIGTETLQIITGADNLKAGDFIPVAVHGSTLANGLKIKKGKMRGLDSNGMLCSIDELGYTVADYPEACEDGIYVFQDEHSLGADVRPIMQLCEEVVDFDILSNRPDTNSVMGMAREAAAVYGKTLVLPEVSIKEEGDGSINDLVTVEIKDPVRCPRYIARVVKNVKVGPSPQWLRRRLSTAGIRPINNIVDITNYVMLEYGQPLHAFDISAVAVKDGKHGIVVRTAQKGEKFTTLDGEERELTETTLLIADYEKPIGIAGVMGGENSKILDDTTTILFESANFDSANIRHTSRALGMRTDASARYEKGQDPNQALTSVNRAMELVEQLCCGSVVPGIVDAYPTPRLERTIDFKPCAIDALLGISTDVLGPAQMCEYLARVGIKTSVAPEGTHMEAVIPTFRADISGEADLAEEVARFYGLNNIPSSYKQVLSGQSLAGNIAGKTPRRRRQDNIKRTMTALGYSETLTYPFESPKVYDRLNISERHPFRNAVYLKNPLGEDFSLMRTLPFGGLLESLARNHNKGNDNVSLFEIADTYEKGEEGYAENPYLAMVSYGENVDYLSLKGDVETLLSTVTNRPSVYVPYTDFDFMHPGRTAMMSVKTSPNPRDEAAFLGILGELHPGVAKNYDIGKRVYVVWLCMESLHKIAEAYKFKFVSPAVYPPLFRDLAFKVKENVTAAELEAAIKEKGGQLLSEVALFDVYQGAQVGEGYKSMAYSLKFRANDRTLTVPEVQISLDAIVNNLHKKFEAEVRS